MKTELQNLLKRLEGERTALICAVARSGAFPATSSLRRIAYLEIAIGAVSALIADEQRSSGSLKP